jgi:hypothetical protein
MKRLIAAALCALAACAPAPEPETDPVQVQGPDRQANSLRMAATVSPPRFPQEDCPPPAGLDAYRAGPARDHGRLRVLVLTRPGAETETVDCLTLEEALASGTFKVTEKSGGAQVSELQIENTGERPVYLQAGDTVKGGKQDRTIAVDALVPPRSGPRGIHAFCVEPGRWETRSGASTAALSFTAAPTTVASNGQKLAVKLAKDQGRVWDEGRKVNRSLADSAGKQGAADSFVLAAEDPKVKARIEEAVEALRTLPDGRGDAIGVAFCLDGKLQSIELYAAPALFRKLWPKLLRSAALEAAGSTPAASAAPAPGPEEVLGRLASLKGRSGKAERRPDGQGVRLYDGPEAAFFDTEDQGRLLHRQWLAK